MNAPTTCLACGDTLEPAEVREHLQGHQVSTANLEELLQTIRNESLTDVGTAAATAREGRELLDQAVASARATGASWTEIGQAAGMTRQSARERWSR